MLWPTAQRPYIGSTGDNSLVSLIFGYNGVRNECSVPRSEAMAPRGWGSVA